MPTTAKTPNKAAAKPKRALLTAAAEPINGKAGAKPAKVKKPLVRDSFSMPAADFDLISVMKLRAIKLMRPVKKSELLRGGLHALAELNDTRFCSTLDALTPLKPGRPKKAG